MIMQRTERGEEVVPVVASESSRQHLTVSKQIEPSLAQNNRQRFLRRVRAFWIDGVLEHSLHGAALIALGLQEQLDALANPWHLVLHHPDTAPRPFPQGTRISEIYDAANGQLLILGAPGAGKTTLVLELARDLRARAEQDAQQQMPVIFTLSSWADKQPPLTEWMIEELINKYQVPHQLAHVWVETNQLLPLLDGLDEVETLNRTRCIETINTYHDMAVEDLLREGVALTRQQVFERYVERMVERRGEKVKYRPERTRNWLAWLARKMKGQSQTVFYLEHLPPDWLSEHRLLQVYNRWAVQLPGIFIGSLVFLVVTMFINSFDLSLSLVLQTLLVGGFIGWILSERGRIRYPKEAEGKATNARWHFLVQLLGAGGLIGFGIGLSDWPGRELYYRLFDGFIFGLSSILMLAILKGYMGVSGPANDS